MFRLPIFILAALLALNSLCRAQSNSHPGPPPAAPGTISLKGRSLFFIYEGDTLLKARIANDPDGFYFREVTDSVNGKIFQAFTLTSVNSEPITLEGTITASSQSFPCEENRAIGSTVVRHSTGLSRSLLNKAVYDRERDWSFSAEQARVRIMPLTSSANKNIFSIVVNGREICFLFKPRYYQKHRGLAYFEPWNYRVWDKPVVGWSSWFAYFDKVTADDIEATADVLGAVLKPYGLEYLQIDDGYQQETSYPEKWINANGKFPKGMAALSDYITSRGLKPGIWTNVAFSNRDWALAHPSLFVTDTSGIPVKGRWVGYSMDGSNPAAIDQLIRPVYSAFRKTGWKYFKLDALRHLRYEGYNSNSSYFGSRKTDRAEAFRNVVKAVRAETGKENFLLACWGIRTELVGIVDGCRIGDDGYGLRTLTQYNSFNNVVWRNDPDHIELKPGIAYQACMATSMTGSLFMLTDKPGVYHTPLVEAARRTIPVMFTLPGQIYDVDPSASMYLDRTGSELSGSGVRVFDARLVSPYTHFLLEMNKPYESWMLFGRTDESRDSINFSELGLDPEKEYLVFEFWTKKYLGAFRKSFGPGKIDSKFNCQLFCIREKPSHPWILATGRHISCGGLELENLSWKAGMLEGRSRLVGGDLYELYIYEPGHSEATNIECSSARVAGNTSEGGIRKVTLLSEKDAVVDWIIRYAP